MHVCMCVCAVHTCVHIHAWAYVSIYPFLRHHFDEVVNRNVLQEERCVWFMISAGSTNGCFLPGITVAEVLNRRVVLDMETESGNTGAVPAFFSSFILFGSPAYGWCQVLGGGLCKHHSHWTVRKKEVHHNSVAGVSSNFKSLTPDRLF